MSKTKRIKTAVGVTDRTDPYYALGSSRVESDKFWRWGDDNLFPAALALMARRSTTHRRIINDKADYISGKGFTCDETQQPQLAAFVRCVNGRGESLRQVLGKLAFDKSLFGNAFLEAVTDPGHTFLSLYHQDASRCRVARDSKHILLHHDWTAFKPAEARTLPLYPDFEVQEDGTLRSIVHYKDYEPMFEHYGVPPYIAGFSVSAIAWKTDRWNISRLDNSFQLSGVMMLDSSVDNEAEAERIVRLAEQKFAGNPGHTFLSLYHQDASRCRVARDSKHILLHHDWTAFKPAEARTLPLYPDFEVQEDGTLRSIVHYKDYEPMFEHYGVPPYIAGFSVSAIAWKTDRWNISRLDNSFQLSGVMMLDSSVDNEAEAERIVRLAEQKFAGNPGQVMFVIRDGGEDDNSRFIPIAAQNEGDWQALHEQAVGDIVVAHSWFRTLSGLDYAAGFSAERILHEYEVALNTVILAEQAELTEPIRAVIGSVLGLDTASLQIVNRPPTRSKPIYMKVWEARKADGLDYDPEDERQQAFLSEITKYNIKSIE
nr:MAG TPA: portal protein [Caudoviricetes sp.]